MKGGELFQETITQLILINLLLENKTKMERIVACGTMKVDITPYNIEYNLEDLNLFFVSRSTL